MIPKKRAFTTGYIGSSVTLYLLAIEKAPADSYFYAENVEASYGQPASATSHAQGFERATRSRPFREAEAELGDWTRYAIASNSRVRATYARRLLGWQPKEPSAFQWIASLPRA